jgi:hypothetical protein
MKVMPSTLIKLLKKAKECFVFVGHKEKKMRQANEIRLIAYNIWEEEGCLAGHDCEHWFRAEAIWEQRQRQPVVGESIMTESKQTIKQNTGFVAAKKKSQRT